jgi:hypothetical protein
VGVLRLLNIFLFRPDISGRDDQALQQNLVKFLRNQRLDANRKRSEFSGWRRFRFLSYRRARRRAGGHHQFRGGIKLTFTPTLTADGRFI